MSSCDFIGEASGTDDKSHQYSWMQGYADIVAGLLLRLVDSGRSAEVVRLNNCLVDSDRTQEATAIASEYCSLQKAYLYHECRWFRRRRSCTTPHVVGLHYGDHQEATGTPEPVILTTVQHNACAGLSSSLQRLCMFACVIKLGP